METSQILGYIATAMFSLMYIPQMYKTIKTKSIDDVSLVMFIVGFVANIDALVYATMIGQRPLQIKYTIALVAIGAYLVIYYNIKRKRDARRKAETPETGVIPVIAS